MKKLIRNVKQFSLISDFFFNYVYLQHEIKLFFLFQFLIYILYLTVVRRQCLMC